jgi:hypothetical protein
LQPFWSSFACTTPQSIYEQLRLLSAAAAAAAAALPLLLQAVLPAPLGRWLVINGCRRILDSR